jgi:hypothetical protein
MRSSTHNLVHRLRDRQYGHQIPVEDYLNQQIRSKINENFSNISTLVNNLRTAMSRQDWNQISTATHTLITHLLDTNNQYDSLSSFSNKVTHVKKEEREFFVLLGGMNLLFQFLCPPLSQATDARHMNPTQLQRYSIFWNEVLVLLREICYSVPNLANQIFSDTQIVFLFTMLSHDSLFDCAINLLEEILAIRLESFSLSQIPNLYSLINSFTTRRLAHFCRVLALVLFEPEDRVIMENSQILRSYELLLLRRDRMNKFSVVDIERNQCLIIEMPGLLKKLVSLLKFANYGPSISELLQNNFAMPNELTTEFIMHLSPARNRDEWAYLDSLEKLLRPQSSRNPTGPQRSRQAAAAQGRGTHHPTLDSWIDHLDSSIDEFSLFSPGDDLDDPSLPSPPNSYLSTTTSTRANNNRDMEHTLLDLMRVMRSGNHTPQQALNELQFQALALAPHQVELIFVLCTLLSGTLLLPSLALLSPFSPLPLLLLLSSPPLSDRKKKN